MKQYEAVIQVMRANGGYATLGLLYQEALKVPDVVWNTNTPFSLINRIVQTNDEFFKVRPGLWALKEHKSQVPKELFSEFDLSKPETVEVNHSYYQRLLIEIGNLKKRVTFVPAQDGSRQSVGAKLRDLITLKQIYQFGYPEMVKRASTIDVIWFNERKMPEVLYEVEHTTDIQNSLLKFVDLQDFNTEFVIVANASRKSLFDRKIAFEAFRSIRSRVKFRSYDQISEWHTKTFELSLIENVIGLYSPPNRPILRYNTPH